MVKKVWRMDKEVKLGRGRPEQTWDAVVRRDLKERGLRRWHVIEMSGRVEFVSRPLLNKETGDDDDECT